MRTGEGRAVRVERDRVREHKDWLAGWQAKTYPLAGIVFPALRGAHLFDLWRLIRIVRSDATIRPG